MTRQFVKLWFVAMLIAGSLTAIASWPLDADYWWAMLTIGAVTWVIYGVITLLMPWIEK